MSCTSFLCLYPIADYLVFSVFFIVYSSIKVSPKQYNIPYKAYACLILKKIRHTFFQAI